MTVLHPSDLEEDIKTVNWGRVPRQPAVALALTIDMANAAEAERVRRQDSLASSRVVLVAASVTVLLGLLLGIPLKFVLGGILAELLVLHIINVFRDRSAKKRARSIVEEARREIGSLARRFPVNGGPQQ